MTALAFHRGVPLRYAVDRARLSASLRGVFVELDLDASTRAFIDDAMDKPTSTTRLALRAAARTLMSDYDANALFDTHSMRVLGAEQWATLLGRHGERWPVSRWLDVGSGDGRVTEACRGFADTLVTTETSGRMAERLRDRGFVCHEIDVATEALPEREPFDVVSALNVIDRTARPYTLVERMRAQLRPNGLLVLAVPVPLSPHVHVKSGVVDPDELLPIDRRGFEEAASTLVDVGLAPLGLAPVFASRVPYLSRGDRQQKVYVLDDLILGLRPVEATGLARPGV